MRRKKANETVAAEPAAESTLKKTTSRSTRAKAPEAAPEPPQVSARTKSRAKTKQEPVTVTDPEPVQARSRSKAKTPPAEPPAAETVPTEVSKRRPNRSKPDPKSTKETPPAKPARSARVPSVQPDPEPAPKPEKSRRTSSRKSKVAPAAASAYDDDLPVPVWRAPAKATAPAKEPEEPTSTLAPRRSRRRKADDQPITAAAALQPPIDDEEVDANGKRRRRRGRRRGRGGYDDLQEAPDQPTAVVAVIQEDDLQVSFRKRPSSRAKSPEPAPPVEQVKPQRRHVPIPSDAPQVILRDGIPTLVRDQKVYPPIFFFGSSPDEKRAETVLEEIRLASARGVHVFVHLVEFVVDPESVNDAVSFAGYLLKKTVSIDPEAQVMFRIVFAAPKGWDKQYPKASYVAEIGGLAEPSVCDDAFWGIAEDCLREFVSKMRLLPLADHVMGVHLERGEWFFADGWGYDTSVAAFEKFQEWVRLRYRNDVVSLRAAWFDGQVHFETVSVPEYRSEVKTGEEFVRTGRKARRWVDYHLFLSDATVERIGKLAYAVKEASDGYFLVGASYGYTFEWSHPASGHLSLGKLMRTPELDLIAGPPSYRSREPGGSAAFPSPIDSFALNGKLFISEEDFKTPFSGRGQEPDDFNPVMRNPQALESVHWRGAGAAVAHLSGVCWMDLWGNGWLNSPGIWQRGAQVRDLLVERMASSPGEPDVAVFIDERSLAYLVDQKAFRLLVQDVREAVLRSGLSVGFYLLSDLAHREKFPESKLYVFMNAWDIRPEVRGAIKNRLQRDGKVLFWLYAAGLFDGGRESLERVREVTGIALKPQPFASKPGTTLLNRRHPLCEALPEQLLSGGGTLEPSYFAIPEDGTVLGEYSQTGLPSFVVREFRSEGSNQVDWTSVFLGEPIVTPALFRALGQMAGAHVWNYQEDVVHVRPPFLSVHCSGGGSRTLTLPDKWSAYDQLTHEWAMLDATHLQYSANDGSTASFLVGPKAEIESLLALDPEEMLKVDEIIPRADNTLKQDGMNFDVPIMKLDEWMEESWSEELADDLLIKPSLLDLEPVVDEESDIDQAGRRRRRRNPKRRGGEEPDPRRRESTDRTAPTINDPFEGLNMNVVFRKRE
ncbi:MAG: hypothetical protein K1X67_19470 [Fimbriimonadaceae bacterium]|nr:hypothetical protein [Fimbriimonadaceae bacterium]